MTTTQSTDSPRLDKPTLVRDLPVGKSGFVPADEIELDRSGSIWIRRMARLLPTPEATSYLIITRLADNRFTVERQRDAPSILLHPGIIGRDQELIRLHT